MPAKKLPDNLAIDVEEASKPDLVKYMTKHKIDPPLVGTGSKNNVVKADLQKTITNWIDGKKAGSSNVIKKGAAAAATSPMEALTKTLAALLTTKNDTAPKKMLTKISEAPKWPGGTRFPQSTSSCGFARLGSGIQSTPMAVILTDSLCRSS